MWRILRQRFFNKKKLENMMQITLQVFAGFPQIIFFLWKLNLLKMTVIFFYSSGVAVIFKVGILWEKRITTALFSSFTKLLTNYTREFQKNSVEEMSEQLKYFGNLCTLLGIKFVWTMRKSITDIYFSMNIQHMYFRVFFHKFLEKYPSGILVQYCRYILGMYSLIISLNR